MNKLYSLSKLNYEAISFRSKYLYQDFNAVRSMLKNQNLSSAYINQLLEPKLNGDVIEWYGNYDGNFTRLTELDDSMAHSIRKKFSDFKKQTEDITNKLITSRDRDAKEWGQYFTELFNPESIILLGNSQTKEWAILWGFKFNSGNENNYTSGSTIIGPVDIEETPNPIEIEEQPKATENEIDPIIIKEPETGPEEVVDKPEITENQAIEPTIQTIPATRMGCLGRIKHWLRWISYRFWGLFWLIIYTLLIIWLCRYCDKPNCDDYCKQLKRTKKELERLEERVRERCDTTYVKGK